MCKDLYIHKDAYEYITYIYYVGLSEYVNRHVYVWTFCRYQIDFLKTINSSNISFCVCVLDTRLSLAMWILPTTIQQKKSKNHLHILGGSMCRQSVLFFSLTMYWTYHRYMGTSCEPQTIFHTFPGSSILWHVNNYRPFKILVAEHPNTNKPVHFLDLHCVPGLSDLADDCKHTSKQKNCEKSTVIIQFYARVL